MDLQSLNLTDLQQRCAEESSRFFKKLHYDAKYCYEIFHRAIVNRNETAWEALVTQYTPQLRRWFYAHPNHHNSEEEPEFFINGVFLRFHKTIAPHRFLQFDSLAQVLSYLRLTLHNQITDDLRKQRAPKVDIDELYDMADDTAVADDPLDKREFWALILEHTNNEQEKALVDLMLAKQMKPAEIVAARPDLFDNVTQVYRNKENMMGRWRRNQKLQEMFTALYRS